MSRSRKAAKAAVDTDHAHNAEVVRLRASGWTFQAIATKFGITRQAAHQTFWREMDVIRVEREQIASTALDEIIERERALIEHEFEKLQARCVRCHGDGRVFPHTEAEQNKPPVGEGQIHCPECKGNGYAYGPIIRSQAVASIQRSDNTLIRLFGLYAPGKQTVNVAHTFRDDLAKLTDDELEAQIAAYREKLDEWGITGVDE